jgi:hypothetical protein
LLGRGKNAKVAIVAFMRESTPCQNGIFQRLS